MIEHTFDCPCNEVQLSLVYSNQTPRTLHCVMRLKFFFVRKTFSFLLVTFYLRDKLLYLSYFILLNAKLFRYVCI